VGTHEAIESLKEQLDVIEAEREKANAPFDGAIAGIKQAIAALNGGDPAEQLESKGDLGYTPGTKKALERDRFALTQLYHQDDGRLNHDQILRRSQGLFNTRGGVWSSIDRLAAAGLVNRISGRPPIAEITAKGRRLAERAGFVESDEPQAEVASEPKAQPKAEPKARKPKKKREVTQYSLAEHKREILRRVSEGGSVRRIEITRPMIESGYGRFVTDKALAELLQQGALDRHQIHPRAVEYRLPQRADHVTINPGAASAEPPFIQYRN
jgi:hypothetical protein